MQCHAFVLPLALFGDAISHAVLPGIAIAFLLSGTCFAPAMVLGAGALGLVTTFLVEAFQRAGVQEDAGIGVSVGGQDLGPRALWTMGTIFLLKVGVLGAFYKAVTTLSAFESVGAILVVAMMIAPAVTAYLLTERLGVRLLLSVAQGVISSVVGYLLARWLDSSIAAAMTTVSGALFMLALLLAPRSGLMARAVARRALRRLAD